MRAIIVALAISIVMAFQNAWSEPGRVSGGVSCGENGIGGFDIEIEGEIDNTTVDRVRRLFDELHQVMANGGATNVPARPGSAVKCTAYGVGYKINSLGGDVSAAIAIGRMFRKENAHIQVNRNSICISACVLILAGAVDRQVSGMVGIHRPYFGTTPQQSMTPDQVKDAYRKMLQQIQTYLHEMNVSDRLADDMLATEPERVHVLTDAELKAYGLIGIDSAEQQRRAIENEARDVQEANQLGLDRREYTRRKSVAIKSCIYSPATGEIMSGSEMLDCRRRILTTGR